MRFLTIFLFFLFSTFFLTAQTNSDCVNSLRMEGLNLSVGNLSGSGEIVEISGNELGNKMYFTEEHNTIWISFRSPEKANLTFDITPKNPSEDYDFMLFEGGIGACPGIKDKSLKPLRSNLSRNDELQAGKTGLSSTANLDYVAAGVNPNMSKMVETEKDKSYILVVDINKMDTKGFDLKLNFEKTEEITIEEIVPFEESDESSSSFDFVDMTESTENNELINLTFNVYLEGTENPIKCNAEIKMDDMSVEDQLFSETSSFTAEIPKDKWFYVNVKKEGYTFGTEKYKATKELQSGTQNIYISPIKKGSHIVLKEIVFRENTTHLLPTSINALNQLIDFMNEYPTAMIEIQGHVNAPGLDNDGKVVKFSLKRAEQIKEYLVAEGIDGKRIKVTGLGNTKMIYKNPLNYEQEKANRRVEIVILNY